MCRPILERVMGIGPTRPAWKAGILPLNYTRTCDAHKYYHNAKSMSTKIAVRLQNFVKKLYRCKNIYHWTLNLIVYFSKKTLRLFVCFQILFLILKIFYAAFTFYLIVTSIIIFHKYFVNFSIRFFTALDRWLTEFFSSSVAIPKLFCNSEE